MKTPLATQPSYGLRPPCGWRTWLVAALCVLGANAHASELKVVAPNAVKDSVVEITTRFEKETGQRVQLTWGGSESIAKRIADGEVFDVVVNTSQGLERMATAGKLVSVSRTDFSRSAVAVAVRSGLPRPDISTVAGLKAALLRVQTIAISSGASGRYLEQLFQKLEVAEQIKHKIKQPPSGAQIGEMLARGEADLGFQQVTELMHAKGIDYLGPLPAEIQNYTVWSAGVYSGSSQADAAGTFIRALRTSEAGASIRKSGMEPI